MVTRERLLVKFDRLQTSSSHEPESVARELRALGGIRWWLMLGDGRHILLPKCPGRRR